MIVRGCHFWAGGRADTIMELDGTRVTSKTFVFNPPADDPLTHPVVVSFMRCGLFLMTSHVGNVATFHRKSDV